MTNPDPVSEDAREARRQATLRDVAILAGRPSDPDLDALAAFVSKHPVDLGD